MDNIESLLALPQVRVLSEGEDFWKLFREVSTGLALRGNTVSDAHVASIMRQHGVKTLYTNDTDFRRFEFLEIRNPFA